MPVLQFSWLSNLNGLHFKSNKCKGLLHHSVNAAVSKDLKMYSNPELKGLFSTDGLFLQVHFFKGKTYKYLPWWDPD